MLDPKLVEEKPNLLKESLRARGFKEMLKDADSFIKSRKEWRALKAKLDNLRHKRNVVSKAINEAIKAGKKQEAAKKKQEAKKISTDVRKAEERISELNKRVSSLALEFPNLAIDLPKKDKVISTHGKVKRNKWFKSYEEISSKLRLIDFNSATNMSGAGFYVLTGAGAKLERSLVNFFLDCGKKNGYKEISPPLLVTEAAMTNSGQLPKFKEGMFVTQEGLYLIPTSEVSLLNLFSGKILKEADLPIYIMAFSPCFRVEKGATKGYSRVKQFTKVELFKFVRQEDSDKELDKMLKDVIQILKLLEVPFRVKLLSAEETGFAAAKTYDVDVFAPGSNEWFEVSSCSNCTDFQARRARIRYATKNGEKKFVHTINGSGLAIPRTFITILENFQQKDGSVKLPKALKSYFGKDKISGG